jgi:hypothetical protein
VSHFERRLLARAAEAPVQDLFRGRKAEMGLAGFHRLGQHVARAERHAFKSALDRGLFVSQAARVSALAWAPDHCHLSFRGLIIQGFLIE